ncbi:alpha-N-arabinofuranosidase [Fibrella aestuarina BUZ 2]|uniref:Alpha-N-arabinofuranosidase n=1 Tax=Fibrella aestuarina BUZ 2 TaxID=1166018 RepID=I0K1R6_9BACT|nr:glycoside hydrolase family 43 protein [Fibrella aestuarina]CCG98069.1 alpha-N-arabinofuranosidase [Fibrella aestuarina BUZ 2]
MTAQPAAVVNPLLNYGPDPWALCHDGYFYYTHSTNSNLTIWKVKSLADLAQSEGKVVWEAPASGPFSGSVWAPEMHYLDNGQGHKCWYAYLSAANRETPDRQRIWVLENDACDPIDGRWTVKNELVTPDNKWGIDGTVIDLNGQLYFAWSGWAGDQNEQQNIYLCRMSNPWTCVGDRLLLSEPHLPWERHNRDADPASVRNRILVNEAPAFLHHGDHLFVAYSASGCWTDEYAFGLLHARTDSDLMAAASWTKCQEPVFSTSPETDTYGPGHGCFFKTETGQTWLLYHANPRPNLGCENERTPRLQPIGWLPDGMPDFGVPVTEVVLETGE